MKETREQESSRRRWDCFSAIDSFLLDAVAERMKLREGYMDALVWRRGVGVGG